MTSGVLVCIKNKTAAFFKKKNLTLHSWIYLVSVWNLFGGIMLKLSNRHTPSLPALSLRRACHPRRGRLERLGHNTAHSGT